MSNDTNEVVIIGRLTRDAEIKMTSSGQSITSFSIAVNRSVKKGDEWTDEASFFDVTLWGKIGEIIGQYLTKGKQVAVVGSLRQDRWTDKEGANRSKVVINAEMVQLLGSGSAQAGQGEAQGAPSKETPHGAKPSAQGDGFQNDIPF
jgi:single-strand DNA-binding protein